MNTIGKRKCLSFWAGRQFLRSPRCSPRDPSYAENVAIAMLNIKDLDPNEESSYSSKINLQCIGVQMYTNDEAKDRNMSTALAMNKFGIHWISCCYPPHPSYY